VTTILDENVGRRKREDPCEALQVVVIGTGGGGEGRAQTKLVPVASVLVIRLIWKA
jgi:hypothetical protein